MGWLADGVQRSAGTRSRRVTALAGAVLGSAAAWFAASWIDAGYDDTCGAVIYPGMWLDSSSPTECRAPMVLRWAIAVTFGLTGLALVGAACVGHRPLRPSRATLVLAAATVTSMVLLVINEAVRSGGAL